MRAQYAIYLRYVVGGAYPKTLGEHTHDDPNTNSNRSALPCICKQ